MVIQPLTTLPITATALPGILSKVDSPFSDTFQKVADPAAYAKRRAEAEKAAAGLVSQALILPMLKQIRRSVFAAEGPFAAGTGEKTFGPEFDMHMADRIAQSPRLGVTAALTDRLMKRGPSAAKRLDVHG